MTSHYDAGYMPADLRSSLLAITGVVIYESVISCAGVVLLNETAHEYLDRQRGQALDGASKVGSGSGQYSRTDHH